MRTAAGRSTPWQWAVAAPSLQVKYGVHARSEPGRTRRSAPACNLLLLEFRRQFIRLSPFCRVVHARALPPSSPKQAIRQS